MSGRRRELGGRNETYAVEGYLIHFHYRIQECRCEYPFGQTTIAIDSSMTKLARQRRERLAGVWLDPAARKLLTALDRETSIRWEDIPDMAECKWSEAARAAALLAGANLCEVSPTRIRLSEYGDKLLAEPSLTEQTSHEVAI